MSQDGNEIWKNTISEDGKSFRATSIVQLPNEDFLIYSMLQLEEFSFDNKLQLTKISPSGELIWTKEIDTSINNSRQLVYFQEDNSIIGLSEKTLGAQNGEIKLHKFDLNGNVIWEKTITTPGDLWSLTSTITKLEDGDFLISFSSSIGISSSDHDVFLIKINQEGVLEWEKTFGGNKSDLPSDVIQTDDGNFMLLSNTSSFGNGGFDVMLSKIDQSGKLIWDKTYGDSMSDQAHKIEERPNGNLIIIGNSNEGNSSVAKFSAFVLETDYEGNPQ